MASGIHANKIKFLCGFLLGGLAGFVPAYAQSGTPSASSSTAPVEYKLAEGPDLDLALKMAMGAIHICAKKGFAVSASVVDSAGIVKVTLRADGAPKPPVAAPRKAATAVAFDLPGSIMEPREASDAIFGDRIRAQPDVYNAHGGSLPLHRNGKLIGGLAVADAPHITADQCVREALTTYGEGLN